jgi:endonuclease/exonuclease/phosphatase family metal-dependent hydrolase
MKNIVIGIGQILLLLVGIFVAILALNYFDNSIHSKTGRGENLRNAGTEITVLDWNLGYAGLGEESDFIVDGGENLLPPSREIVEKNLKGIQGILRTHEADIYLIQEAAKPDMLTWGVDVFDGVLDALKGYDWLFSHDINSRYIPCKYAVHHGLATLSKIITSPVDLVKLPYEPTRINGLIKRKYHIQVREFSDKNGEMWAVMNVHLSAFDEGGNVRVIQLKKMMEIANSYYEDGKHVVVGGDWNMQLVPTDFPHTTKDEYLFWLKQLPYEHIKKDWEIITDTTVASVRTNERPYHKGENFTTIIDGFLVSPNVETLSVKTVDTEFKYTDHQPVLATFKARN